jgi:hypothetical protein
VCKSANVSSNYRNSGIINEENGKLGAVLGTPEHRDFLYVTIQSGTDIGVYFVFSLDYDKMVSGDPRISAERVAGWHQVFCCPFFRLKSNGEKTENFNSLIIIVTIWDFRWTKARYSWDVYHHKPKTVTSMEL